MTLAEERTRKIAQEERMRPVQELSAVLDYLDIDLFQPGTLLTSDNTGTQKLEVSSEDIILEVVVSGTDQSLNFRAADVNNVALFNFKIPDIYSLNSKQERLLKMIVKSISENLVPQNPSASFWPAVI